MKINYTNIIFNINTYYLLWKGSHLPSACPSPIGLASDRLCCYYSSFLSIWSGTSVDQMMAHLYPVHLPIFLTDPTPTAILRSCTGTSEAISSFHRHSDWTLLCWRRAKWSLFANCVPQTPPGHLHCMSHHLWCFLIPCIIDWRLRPTLYGFASYYSSFEADCDAAILVLDLRIRSLRLHLGWDLCRCGQPFRSYLRMFILNTIAGHNYSSKVLCSCFCGTSSSMMSAAVRSWSALSRPAGGRSLLHVGSLILSTDLLAYLGYCCIHPNHRRLQFGNSFGFCFGTLVNLVSSITSSSVCKYFGYQPRLSGIGFCLQSTWLSWSAVAEAAWAAS